MKPLPLTQLLLLLLPLFMCSVILAQDNTSVDENKIEQEEINNFIGAWTGTLTYVDYNSGEPYTMPCDLDIQKTMKKNQLALSYIYPNEPKANNKGRLRISKDGTRINKKRITNKFLNADGQMEIYTENTGKDGNEGKKALIRNMYKIGDKELIFRKDIKFEGSTDWLRRNEYTFERK